MSKTIYFAGGCFWGMEKVLQIIPGVLETTVGYANGITENPTYEEVCSNTTEHRETVKVIYDETQVSLETLLDVFFICINPTVKNRQGNDIGSQYQTGVYYSDDEDKEIIEKKFKEEKERHYVFEVECSKIKCFYDAEEYHQDYLIKNPNGYCHITNTEMEEVKEYLKNR